MKLLETFDGLLNGWRGVFSQQRTFERARRLSFGLLTCLRVHLTSTAICASGRQFQDWSADYRVCSRSPWEPRRLFDVVLDRLPALLPSPEAPVFAALDDTILKKTGRCIPGVKILRDPLSPPFHVNLCYGLRFVQTSVLVSPRDAGPARALPVRFDFAPPARKPKKNAPAEAWDDYKEEKKKRTLSLAGVEAIRSLRQSLDERPETHQRQLIVSGDGSYTNREVLKRLPERTTYIGRLRRDAKLYYPLPAPAGKPVGRPRRYGPVAPTPEQVLKDDDAFPVTKVKCFAAGQLREIPVKVLRPVYWRKAGVDMPLQIVVIKALGYRLRNGSKVLYRQPAFLGCSDPVLDLTTFVQGYINRWEIECNHRDEKSLLGVDQGQVRNPDSVRRLPQLQVAGYSLLLLASILSSGFQRTSDYLPLPKWRRKSIRPSLLDLLALLRDQIFATAAYAPDINFEDFTDASPPAAKSQKQPLASDTLCTLAA
jgi:hypothetical protein